MVTPQRSKTISFYSLFKLAKYNNKKPCRFVTAIALFALVVLSTPANGDNFLFVSEPETSDCGNVVINGVVNTDEEEGYRIFGLVWDWGDGSKTTGWFPASHRYTENGSYSVQVTAAGCPTMIKTKTLLIDTAEAPGCPDPSIPVRYYLRPFNLHMTAGQISAPLQVSDWEGNPVSGEVSFQPTAPTNLVLVSNDGRVTALRTETMDEIGVWISASVDGRPVSNTCVVRVLANDYSGVEFNEEATVNTSLYYPPVINGENIAASVDRFEMATVNEYAYQIQARLMGTSPFEGARQIYELDFGTTESDTHSNRVCGISGNPIRLGWNIEAAEPDPIWRWRNCFLVPWPTFPPPERSPQWGVFYHELGHNMTWASPIFGGAMDHWLYSEGLATAMGLTAMAEILDNPNKYPLGEDAFDSLYWMYHISNEPDFRNALQDWLDAEAVFDNLTPDAMDGIWLLHKAGVPHFADRFFLPLQPLMLEHLGEMLCLIWNGGDDEKHTIFAALMSAAAGANLYTKFLNDYHYPLIQDLYDSAHAAFKGIIAQRECPGDFNKDGSADNTDLTVFAANFGKTGCSGSSCNGDFDLDGDVDGSELTTFILKFGRTDCI